MDNLLRKIARKKWLDNSECKKSEYSADSITGCIRTTHNTLSLWRSETTNFDDIHVKDLVSALATTTQRPDVIDVLWFSESELNELGLEISDSEGNTSYIAINEHHCDIVGMNYEKLGNLGEYLVRRVNQKENVKRFSKKTVFALVQERVERGDIDIRSLSDKWKTAIDPETYPAQS